MPSDEFPQPKAKQELPTKQLEELLTVKLGPDVSFKSIEAAEYCAFITTPDWNIIVAPRKDSTDFTHERLFGRLGLNRSECLIDDGNFKIERLNMDILYFYNESYRNEKVKNIKEATENKIRTYLISKGLKIGNILSENSI